MVEPPPPLLPQAPPTASVMWGPLPWVAAGAGQSPSVRGPEPAGQRQLVGAAWDQYLRRWGRGHSSHPGTVRRWRGWGRKEPPAAGSETQITIPVLPGLPCGPWGKAPSSFGLGFLAETRWGLNFDSYWVL